jgi:hypothetical protein
MPFVTTQTPKHENAPHSQKDIPLKEQLFDALSQKDPDDEKVLQLVNALSELNPTPAPSQSTKAGRCSLCHFMGKILHYDEPHVTKRSALQLFMVGNRQE